MEASSREVGVLGAKVGHAHSQGLDEREKSLRAQEEHLQGTWEEVGGRENIQLFGH